MGYLIDTNIWSELQKGERANAGVRRGYDSVEPEELHISVLVVGEVRRGIERLGRRDPRQAERLEQRLATLKTAMGERILSVSSAIAERWGQLGVPDPLPAIDGLPAATALEHDLVLVTRNIRDVESSGAKLLNPFVPAP
jgi:predicted nucleic acid-binding protein